MAVAHIPFDLRLGCHRRDRVDNDDRKCIRANQRFGNFQRFLTGRRLRNQQGININAQCFCINRVQCVFNVNKRRFTARLLGLCDHLKRNRRLTGRFRSIDFNDSSFWNTANTERNVQTERPGRNNIDVHRLILPQTHQRTGAILFFYLCDNLFKGLAAFFTGIQLLKSILIGVFRFRHNLFLSFPARKTFAGLRPHFSIGTAAVRAIRPSRSAP